MNHVFTDDVILRDIVREALTSYLNGSTAWMMLYLRQPTGLICILGNKRMNDKKRNVRKNGSMHAYLFLLPSLTGVLVLFVIPYLDVLRRSFLDGTGQRFVGMDNYKTVVEIHLFGWQREIRFCFWQSVSHCFCFCHF